MEMKNKFKFLFLLILVSFLVLFFVKRNQEELKEEKNNFLETKTEKVLKNFEGIFISKEKNRARRGSFCTNKS